MNPAISAVVAFLGGWRATILLLLAVALAATVMVQSSRLTDAREDNAKLAAAVLTFEGAQKTNLAAIATLQNANGKWAAAADARSKRADEAVAAVAAERDALAAELNESRRARRDIYENDPSAAAWGRTRVPSRLADRLRK